MEKMKIHVIGASGASLFGYFEKVHEPEVPEADLAALGRPATDFDNWVRSRQ